MKMISEHPERTNMVQDLRWTILPRHWNHRFAPYLKYEDPARLGELFEQLTSVKHVDLAHGPLIGGKRISAHDPWFRRRLKFPRH